MTTELDALTESVQGAMGALKYLVGTPEDACIAESIEACFTRLTTRVQALERKNGELHENVGTLRCAVDSRDEDIALVGEELAAIKKRIADAPHEEVYRSDTGDGITLGVNLLPREWVGKRVALLPLNAEAKS